MADEIQVPLRLPEEEQREPATEVPAQDPVPGEQTFDGSDVVKQLMNTEIPKEITNQQAIEELEKSVQWLGQTVNDVDLLKKMDPTQRMELSNLIEDYDEKLNELRNNPGRGMTDEEMKRLGIASINFLTTTAAGVGLAMGGAPLLIAAPIVGMTGAVSEGFITQPLQRKYDPERAPKTIEEATERIYAETALSMMGEGIGGAVSNVAKGAGVRGMFTDPYGKSTMQMARQGQQLAKDAGMTPPKKIMGIFQEDPFINFRPRGFLGGLEAAAQQEAGPFFQMANSRGVRQQHYLQNVALKAIGKDASFLEPQNINRVLRDEFSRTGHIPARLNDEEAGELIKQGLTDMITKKKTFFAEGYEKFAEEWGGRPMDETAINSLIQQLDQLGLKAGGGARTEITRLKRQLLQNIKAANGELFNMPRVPFTIDVMRNIRGTIAAPDNAPGKIRRLYSVIDSLFKESIDDSLEEISRAEIKALFNSGDDIAGEALNDEWTKILLGKDHLNLQYAEFIKDLNRYLGPMLGGRGTKKLDVSQFLRKLETEPSQNIGRNFFRKIDFERLSEFKAKYPEQFEVLKGFKHAQMIKSSMLPDGRNLDIQKFIGQVEGMPPEVIRELFDTDKIELLTKLNAFVGERPPIVPLDRSAALSTNTGVVFGQGLNSILRAVLGNPLSRNVLRAVQPRPVGTMLGQGIFHGVGLINELSLEGVETSKLFIVPEDRKPALAEKIRKSGTLSSTEKAKHMNLLTKHGYGVIMDVMDDKLTDRQKRLLEIYNKEADEPVQPRLSMQQMVERAAQLDAALTDEKREAMQEEFFNASPEDQERMIRGGF